MAVYTELDACVGNSDLQERVKVAAMIKAREYLVDGAASANKKSWARRMFLHPEQDIRGLTWMVVIANRAFTIEQITGADDTTVTTAVNAVIADFAELG